MEDDPYSGYSASFLEKDATFKVKGVSQKSDGTPLIKIVYYNDYEYNSSNIKDMNSFWCWFYADQWQKV